MHYHNQESIKLYVLVAQTPAADQQALAHFAEQLGKDTTAQLQRYTEVSWQYHMGDSLHLDNTETKRPDDFLQEAFLRMVQTACDVVWVVTDAALISESNYMVPGLAAPEAQVAVISTRKLLTVPAGKPVRALKDSAVRWNAAALSLHLMGHLLRLTHERQGIMLPFEFKEERQQLPSFSEKERAKLDKAAHSLKVQEIPAHSSFSSLMVHLKTLFGNPGEVFKIMWRSRAPLLPFTLTKITTAAIAPAILMFFTDEFWWVGIHRNPVYIWTAAVAAILAATFYIPYSQDLLFPHRERRVITYKVAIANLGMILTIFLMVIGLFIVVTLTIIVIEVWLFPPEMIRYWFKDFELPVSWQDHLLIALSVATLGTLTGALGSGFHGREIIRAVSFFLRKP